MVSIGGVTFIIIIQSIIVLTVLSVFLFFLLRLKNKKIKTLMSGVNEHKNISPTASVEHYLTTEIKLTQGRFDLLYPDDDLQGEFFSEPDRLILRRNFLEMEKELLNHNERADVFWFDLNKNIKKILGEHNLVKRLKIKEIKEDDDDEQKEMKILLKSQYDDFDNIFAGLEGAKNEAEISELKDKLQVVIRSHTELAHCIFILEDENSFLRKQVNELLQ